MPRVSLYFRGEKFEGEFEEGTLLADAIKNLLGWFILPCGGRGICGNCRVRVLEGMLSAPTKVEKKFGYTGKYRLACQARLKGDASLEVESLGERLVVYGVEPLGFDTDPLCEGVGAGIDVGSSKIAGVLIDFGSGRNVAEGFAINPQVGWGLDVISRISVIVRRRDELEKMSRETLKAVSKLIYSLLKKAGREHVDCAVFTGNSVALPITFGIDPTPLGYYPYENPLNEVIELNGEKKNLQARKVLVLPAIKSFVGSDASTAILATLMHGFSKYTVMADIGINTEIAYIVNKEKFLVTSAPAGPAIEGGELSCGSTALQGAASYAYYDAEKRKVVLIPERSEKVGLSGSAIVALIASLVDHGIVDGSGRIMLPDGEVNGVKFVSLGARLRLTQKDIREFQKAKAAISTAINLLIRKVGRFPLSLVLAGSMGSSVDVKSAYKIGLFPRVDNVFQYGNLALVGAKLYMVSSRARRLYEEIRGKAEHVGVMEDTNYQELWMKCLSLTQCEV
ncbi:MAG: hypothetical protein DRJ35_00945 [Thermoprotei archaeon]|nr:MAG: hypothetical protein DRJ35_00945 [Thermoprotei archaeon]